MFSMLVLKLDVADAKYSEERLLLLRGSRLLILFFIEGSEDVVDAGVDIRGVLAGPVHRPVRK